MSSVQNTNEWKMHMAAGRMAFEKGDFAAAEHMYSAALKEAESFGASDPKLAHTLNNLALTYCTQGKHDKAEPLYQRALALDEASLATDDPDLATDLSNLAAHYHRIGRYQDAEQFYKRAISSTLR